MSRRGSPSSRVAFVLQTLATLIVVPYAVWATVVLTDPVVITLDVWGALVLLIGDVLMLPRIYRLGWPKEAS